LKRLAPRASPRLATQTAFVVAGFISGCWAPLVPLAKARLGVDHAQLGVLLLGFGIGSLVGVSLAGAATIRFAARPVIIGAGLGFCALLPALTLSATPLALGAALFGFGACLGALDVAMNAHGVQVEAAESRPMMSGFHALYSLGACGGAGWITLALGSSAPPLAATGLAAVGGGVAMAVASSGLLRTGPRASLRTGFSRPTATVAIIAALAGISFLVEGAVYDWGALLVLARRVAPPPSAGLGYILFSIAMTLGRLLGDGLVARLGPRALLRWSGCVATLGVAIVLASPRAGLALSGFVLIGLGAANIVPVLFSAAGRQRSMAPALAVAIATSTGYAGLLAGPPLIGFTAEALGLPAAFWLLAALLICVPALAGRVTERRWPAAASRL
jgi:predicted MFS family arabinose efflux permease